MKTLFRSLFAAFAASAALAAAPASAVTYVGHAFETPNAGNSVISYGSGAAQSFDVNFGTFTRATLAFITFRDEVAPVMSFNALIGNFTGLNLTSLAVRLTGGAMFQMPSGTVTGTFGVAGPPSVAPTLVNTLMLTPEPLQVNFGNPLSQAGQSNWMVNFSGVNAGSTFGITVSAVPEPGTYLMLLAGLALMGTVVRAKARGNSGSISV